MTDITVSRGALPADHFTIVSNDFQRGRLPVPLPALSRVLLGYLLSLPPTGWTMNRAQLDASVIEGPKAVTTALAKLEAAGYLSRNRRRVGGGRFVWDWWVTDDPIARPLTIPPQPADGATSGNAENRRSHHKPVDGTWSGGSSKKTENQKTEHQKEGASSVDTPVGANASRRREKPESSRQDTTGQPATRSLPEPSSVSEYSAPGQAQDEREGSEPGWAPLPSRVIAGAGKESPADDLENRPRPYVVANGADLFSPERKYVERLVARAAATWRRFAGDDLPEHVRDWLGATVTELLEGGASREQARERLNRTLRAWAVDGLPAAVAA